MNLLVLFESNVLADVFIQAEGREIPAHKAVLAAHSPFFAQQFTENPGHNSVQLDHKHKVVYAMVRFLYFGGLPMENLTSLDCLDLLGLAEDVEVKSINPADIGPVIVAGLKEENCVDVLNHEVLRKYPTFQDAACKFTGEHFMSMVKTNRDYLLKVPTDLLTQVLQYACHQVYTDDDADVMVKYCLSHTGMESTCDLLRETKAWEWGGRDFTVLRSVEEPIVEANSWEIHGVRAAMDATLTPARTVVGTYFDWLIRLDYGAEGKLRLVYEQATPTNEDPKKCIHRFPAAMFAWQVVYNGQSVFHEKPVFICFPQGVHLHWSTTLPITAAELTEDDNLEIVVQMAENPMLSLILYHFSVDLKTTVAKEDILNRLPHIEYRCLSSYSLVQTHGA